MEQCPFQGWSGVLVRGHIKDIKAPNNLGILGGLGVLRGLGIVGNLGKRRMIQSFWVFAVPRSSVTLLWQTLPPIVVKSKAHAKSVPKAHSNYRAKVAQNMIKIRFYLLSTNMVKISRLGFTVVSRSVIVTNEGISRHTMHRFKSHNWLPSSLTIHATYCVALALKRRPVMLCLSFTACHFHKRKRYTV